MRVLAIFISMLTATCFADSGASLYGAGHGVATGGASTETLYPDSDAAVGWTPIGGEANHYLAVSDSSDATYVRTSNSNTVDRYGIANTSASSGKTINKITLNARCYTISEAGAGLLRVFVRIGSNYYFTNLPELTGSLADYTVDLATNPETTSAWTSAEIDAVGSGVYSAETGSDTVGCSEYSVTVDYVP